jgi:lipoprotein signal peptidase
MELQQRPTAIRWYWGTLATAGSLIAAIAVVAVALACVGTGTTISAFYTKPLLLFGLTGIVIGAIVGLGQWLVLRNRLGRIAAWTLATALGVGLGNVTGRLIYAYMTRDCWPSFFPDYCFDFFWVLQVRCVAGAICGTLVGIAQGIALRRQPRYAGWWVLTNIIAWSAGAAAWFLVDWAIEVPFWSFFYDSPLTQPLSVLVNGRFLLGAPLFAVIVGAITGVVLHRLPIPSYHDRAETVVSHK